MSLIKNNSLAIIPARMSSIRTPHPPGRFCDESMNAGFQISNTRNRMNEATAIPIQIVGET